MCLLWFIILITCSGQVFISSSWALPGEQRFRDLLVRPVHFSLCLFPPFVLWFRGAELMSHWKPMTLMRRISSSHTAAPPRWILFKQQENTEVHRTMSPATAEVPYIHTPWYRLKTHEVWLLVLVVTWDLPHGRRHFSRSRSFKHRPPLNPKPNFLLISRLQEWWFLNSHADWKPFTPLSCAESLFSSDLHRC